MFFVGIFLFFYKTRRLDNGDNLQEMAPLYIEERAVWIKPSEAIDFTKLTVEEYKIESCSIVRTDEDAFVQVFFLIIPCY